MSRMHVWAAPGAGQALRRYEFDPGPLGVEEAEVRVRYCGLCHSDLALVSNEWGGSEFPLTPGHEIVGEVVALGERARGLKIGQTVGVGWNSASCLHCRQCLSGNQHLCPELKPVINGQRGGFADTVRAHWQWVFPLPQGLDAAAAGPLMCGGITVFAPVVAHGIRATDHIGIVGIGGLGHMALRFAREWGCEVTAFTHTPSKREDCRRFGADHVLSSVDSRSIRRMAGRLDMVLVCTSVALDWRALFATLAPKGRLHIVGGVMEPIKVSVLGHLIADQRELSGSPGGPPAVMADMLGFAARRRITPQVEHFPMSRVNEAMGYLAAGRPRYRVVLDADF